MCLIDKLCEARIAEAVRRGEFENLPGEGKPLKLDDDALVPKELRAAYRLLKNAGYLPPELALRREISEIEQLLQMTDDHEACAKISRRLNYLMMRLNCSRQDKVDLRVEQTYLDKLQQQLG
jgi:hypothetical protein